ncbi:DnaJ domain-containing protein [Desulfocicer vacuolatum DSM 3385]|uniref:DnaJ domain-containing protein n=1 Tax=Desulfocicer vacuolatum DSM 3385 TaxID=1121400 RepID=A0A1W2DJU3_9BACT|nr:J domain-containing protein [Desulfocicer vacuolatum]SMC97790.1 DnaJ domain-containing protein [Desulfocicer vacuolatum DSM 3385]
MYIARETVHGKINFSLRISVPSGEGFKSRDLYDLGHDPASHIIYPGGNSYYINEKITDAISKLGIPVDDDRLESLFMSFISPEIRRAVETFQNRGGEKKKPISPEQHHFIQYRMPWFDKRRLLFLKFGQIDPGPVENMPPRLFRELMEKSRDEIEHNFMRQENRMDLSEFKTYVYSSLNLQRCFESFLAKQMPQALDQEEVDNCFINELCAVNKSLFPPSTKSAASLHPFLHRYVIMFFDHGYAHSTLLDEFAHNFMNRHRRTHPPPGSAKTPISLKQALANMELDHSIFQAMTSKQLTRHYRTLARKHHPDKGGEKKQFIALNEAYEYLMEKMR